MVDGQKADKMNLRVTRKEDPLFFSAHFPCSIKSLPAAITRPA